MEIPALIGCLVLYLVATASFIGHLLLSHEALRRAGGGALALAFVIHTVAIAARSVQGGYIAVTNFHEGVSVLAWSIVGAYLILHPRYQLAVPGAFVSPLAFVFTLSAFVFYSGVRELPENLQSAWLPAHIAPAFLGYAILAVSFCVSLTYLLQEKQLKTKRRGGLLQRLPSLEALDQLNHRFVTWGFSLFTVAIVTGALLAKARWGAFWSWEPVQVLSAVTWTLYAVLLHTRTVGWRGRKAAALTVLGFAVLVMSFFGVSLVFPGKHGGAFG